MHMGMHYFPYCSLHAHTREELLQYTLEHGRQLLRAFCRDRLLIPQGEHPLLLDLSTSVARCCTGLHFVHPPATGNLLEVSFTDLERDPVSALRGVYESFGWSGFCSLEGRLAGYTASLAGFRKNQHVQVSREHARRVELQWREAFTEFGYPLPEPPR